MRLADILDIYHKELNEIYGSNEIESLFYLTAEHFLKIQRIQLIIDPEYSITKEEEQPLFETLSELKLQRPIQYILGETSFFGLSFKVNEHTLIPRQETEELVAWIIETQKNNNKNSIKILDIGTGSGCIAVALAKHIKNAEVYASDLSEDVLAVARTNAELNEVNVHFVQADILLDKQDTTDLYKQDYDIIVSNPPYIRQLEKAEIKPNVLDHEPHQALFVEDDDPLVFYRSISQFASQHLKDGGQLYFEINEYLGEDMISLLNTFNFNDITLKKDLNGKDRMLRAVKP